MDLSSLTRRALVSSPSSRSDTLFSSCTNQIRCSPSKLWNVKVVRRRTEEKNGHQRQITPQKNDSYFFISHENVDRLTLTYCATVATKTKDHMYSFCHKKMRKYRKTLGTIPSSPWSANDDCCIKSSLLQHSLPCQCRLPFYVMNCIHHMI